MDGSQSVRTLPADGSQLVSAGLFQLELAVLNASVSANKCVVNRRVSTNDRVVNGRVSAGDRVVTGRVSAGDHGSELVGLGDHGVERVGLSQRSRLGGGRPCRACVTASAAGRGRSGSVPRHCWVQVL